MERLNVLLLGLTLAGGGLGVEVVFSPVFAVFFCLLLDLAAVSQGSSLHVNPV